MGSFFENFGSNFYPCKLYTRAKILFFDFSKNIYKANLNFGFLEIGEKPKKPDSL
tara:strand:+ start:90 stop:254 length:165 start_codon:yes stop_codon:yes gene_type:complete